MADKSHLTSKRMEISQQQISTVAALFLIFAFFIFLAGVFWGKKTVLEVTQEQLTSDSFADTIYNAFYVTSYEKKHRAYTLDEQRTMQIETNEHLRQSESVPQDSQNESDNGTDADGVKDICYYAPLGSFNTLVEAQRSAQKLNAEKVLVRILERMSKTSSGTTRVWYQLVTEPYADRDELLAMLHCLKRICLTIGECSDSAIIEINNEQKQMLFGKKGL